MTRGTIGLVLTWLACTVASPNMPTHYACHEATATFKDLLARHDEWFTQERYRVTFDHAYELITGSSMETIRDDFLCDFDDVRTLDELVFTLESRGDLPVIFECVYNYATVLGCSHYKYPWGNVPNSLLQLIKHLGESGVLSMNPEGFDWLSNVTAPGNIDIFFDEDMLSSDPMTTQVIRVTNDLRQVWNDVVLQMSTEHPDASEWLRDEVAHWTGIMIPSAHNPATHNYMRTIITYVLGTTKSETEPPLTNLYNLLKYRGVLRHLQFAAYPHVIDYIQWAEHQLMYWSDSSNEGSNDVTSTDELIALTLKVIELLRIMGLLNLQGAE